MDHNIYIFYNFDFKCYFVIVLWLSFLNSWINPAQRWLVQWHFTLLKTLESSDDKSRIDFEIWLEFMLSFQKL